jgi:hypothetical protein
VWWQWRWCQWWQAVPKAHLSSYFLVMSVSFLHILRLSSIYTIAFCVYLSKWFCKNSMRKCLGMIVNWVKIQIILFNLWKCLVSSSIHTSRARYVYIFRKLIGYFSHICSIEGVSVCLLIYALNRGGATVLALGSIDPDDFGSNACIYSPDR